MSRGIMGSRAGALLAIAASGMFGHDRRRVMVIDEVVPYPDEVRAIYLDMGGDVLADRRPVKRSTPWTQLQRHPEGPCSYRATGSKRTRRRNRARRFARWAERGCLDGGPGCTRRADCMCSAYND